MSVTLKYQKINIKKNEDIMLFEVSHLVLYQRLDYAIIRMGSGFIKMIEMGTLILK